MRYLAVADYVRRRLPKRRRTPSQGGSAPPCTFSRPSVRLSGGAPSLCGLPRHGLPDRRTSRRGRRGPCRCAHNVRHHPLVRRRDGSRTGRRSRRVDPRLRSRSFGRSGRRLRHACRIAVVVLVAPLRTMSFFPSAARGLRMALADRRTSRSRRARIAPIRAGMLPNALRDRRTSRLGRVRRPSLDDRPP